LKAKIIAICSSLAVTFATAEETPSRDSASALIRATLDPTSVADLATHLATVLANNQAKKRFDVEPFSATSGTAVFRSDRWDWQGIAGYRAGDVRATVSFKANGAEPVVEVAMLVSTPD
jgi:hypothetical protein